MNPYLGLWWKHRQGAPLLYPLDWVAWCWSMWRLRHRSPITRQTLRAPDGTPFLRRWVLALGPVRLYLHNFTGDDPRPAYHSHPFTAVSLVLRGAYVDVTPYPLQQHGDTPDGSRTVPIRGGQRIVRGQMVTTSQVASPAARYRTLRAPALHLLGRGYHRTEMPRGVTNCWTLMLAWQPAGRAWGFLRRDGRRVGSEEAWAEGLRLAPEPGVRR